MPDNPRAGYTLPVFACAAAVAALRWLYCPQEYGSVAIDLLDSVGVVDVPIEQLSGLGGQMALAITRSDPGDNLDLTRNTPIWALVERLADQDGDNRADRIVIEAGEGIGRSGDQPAIYQYAQRLLRVNLERWLQPGDRIRVRIILPEGRALAKRTSNEAFGVVEGLSLLGTSGIAQPLSAPGQLEAFRQQLHEKAQRWNSLVFCIGENGLDLAAKLGIPTDRTLKTANWLGSLLAEAGLQGLQSIVLFGYHGKLIKLAGGIFHTHHHVADGRREILTAHCANLGLPTQEVQAIFASDTAEAALQHLRSLEQAQGKDWVMPVYGAIAETIDQRCQTYIYAHSEKTVQVGTVMFDRQRRILVRSKIAQTLLESDLRM